MPCPLCGMPIYVPCETILREIGAREVLIGRNSHSLVDASFDGVGRGAQPSPQPSPARGRGSRRVVADRALRNNSAAVAVNGLPCTHGARPGGRRLASSRSDCAAAFSPASASDPGHPWPSHADTPAAPRSAADTPGRSSTARDRPAETAAWS